MAKTESSGKRVAAAASKVLRSRTASKEEKAVAASALTQMDNPKETTGKRVASAASKILQDPRASKEAKSVAASALTAKTRLSLGSDRERAIYEGVRVYFAKKK
jgi:hypothetical protein